MTDKFIILPELQHILDSTKWKVTNAAEYYSSRFNCNVIVIYPFQTDLASIPRFAWLLIPRDDKNIVEPAVFHDWLYANSGRVFRVGNTNIPRKHCDRLLSDAMKLAGAQWWKRHLVYIAVRLGGSKPWNMYKARQVK